MTSINYKDIDLEFEIVGEFPEGRYNQSAVMNRDYLNRALDQYERDNRRKHPLAIGGSRLRARSHLVLPACSGAGHFA